MNNNMNSKNASPPDVVTGKIDVCDIEISEYEIVEDVDSDAKRSESVDVSEEV